MLDWVAAVLLIAVSFGLLRLGLWFIRFYDNRHIQYVEAARQFHEEAKTLLGRRDLSNADLVFIDDLASTINNPHTAMVFFKVLHEKKNKTEKSRPLSKLSDHLADEHMKLHYLWFTAVTARSPFFGSMVRVLIAQQNIPSAVTEVSHKANAVRRSRTNGKLAHA